MVNENGEKWKMLRKHLSPPLTNRKTAQHYAADMNEIADELVDIVSKNSQKLEQDTEGQFLFFIKTQYAECCFNLNSKKDLHPKYMVEILSLNQIL